MKQVPLLLIGVAAIGLAIGIVCWLVAVAFPEYGRQYYNILDYSFYWRGAMLMLTTAIVLVLIQIRDK